VASKAAVEPNPVVADFVRMFLVNWFYGILNSLGLAMKSGKILFLVRGWNAYGAW